MTLGPSPVTFETHLASSSGTCLLYLESSCWSQRVEPRSTQRSLTSPCLLEPASGELWLNISRSWGKNKMGENIIFGYVFIWPSKIWFMYIIAWIPTSVQGTRQWGWRCCINYSTYYHTILKSLCLPCPLASHFLPAVYTLLKSDVTRRDHVVHHCHGSQECWFTLCQFRCQFHSRRHSLRITMKSTTWVHMRSRYAWTRKSWQRSQWRLDFNSVFPWRGLKTIVPLLIIWLISIITQWLIVYKENLQLFVSLYEIRSYLYFCSCKVK